MGPSTPLVTLLPASSVLTVTLLCRSRVQPAQPGPVHQRGGAAHRDEGVVRWGRLWGLHSHRHQDGGGPGQVRQLLSDTRQHLRGLAGDDRGGAGRQEPGVPPHTGGTGRQWGHSVWLLLAWHGDAAPQLPPGTSWGHQAGDWQHSGREHLQVYRLQADTGGLQAVRKWLQWELWSLDWRHRGPEALREDGKGVRGPGPVSRGPGGCLAPPDLSHGAAAGPRGLHARD